MSLLRRWLARTVRPAGGASRDRAASGGLALPGPLLLVTALFTALFTAPVTAPVTAVLAALLAAAPAVAAVGPPATPATAVLPAAPPDGKTVAREAFLEAREADRRGDVEAALAAYGRAFRHDARSRDLCFLYLERLKDAGAVDSARAVADRCVDLTAGDGGRPRAPGESGEPSEGAEALTAAEHKLLGEVALRAEDAPAARHHYEAALRLADEDHRGGRGRGGDEVDVLYVLAGLYEQAGDWERHAAAVRRLLPRLGYPARLMERLGRVYVRLDRVSDFIPVLEEAWERTREPVFGSTLAAHYEANGRHLSLLRIARVLEETGPGAEHEALLARAYVLADRPDSALELTAGLLARARAASRASVKKRARPPQPEADGSGLSLQGLTFLHATLLFERGRYQEARPHAAALVRDAPGEAAHHLLLGSILLELGGRPQEIRAALDRALALAPSPPAPPEYRVRRAYAEYALTARAAGSGKRGRQDPGLLPHTDTALQARVDAWLEAAAPRDDLREEAGVVDAPGGAGSARARDAVAEEHRLLREGFAHGRLAQELAPREPGQRPAVFTDSLASRHHRRRALARYEAILARNSGQRAALFEAAVQYERLGRLDRAKPLFRRLLARDTLHATAMNYLAYTLLEQDTVTPAEMDEAAALLTRALALDPENGAYRDSWGWWHYRRGAYDSALVWLEAAHEAVPGDATILEHLVLTLHALDRRADACATLRRLHALNPRHGVTLHCPTGEAP